MEKSNGYPHAETFAAKAYLKQYVEVVSGEAARQHATPSRMLACRSGVSAVAVEAFMNNVARVP
jgi:hypothetical protein